ncbi:hypothetical protein SLEP1_g31856 [Rubroshorea leprosula]|uniref:Reverse transcriptase domain-containing protein n=2 Tax=Rubroshorea leprosula TaxID=152421 RepID=A0AAV5KBI4_9ROSI|nr:hypothetical protein SLEP1_g31856 [Rubroshorea leprosula]
MRGRARGRVDGRQTRTARATLSYGHGRSRGRSKLWSYRTEEQRRVQGWKPSNEGTYNRGLYNQTTPYFFTNFPEEWSYAEMWMTFRKFGRVLDIYSPSRRSKKGQRFGFVRFLEVQNTKELERRLDQLWVGNFKLRVNIPRFRNEDRNREVEHRKKPREEPRAVPKKQNRTYAEVVKGQYGMEVGGDAEAKQKNSGSRSHGRVIRGSNTRTDLRNRGKTRVWKEKGQGEQWPGMEYNVKEEEYSWLEGCFVGKVHSVEMVRNLQEKFYMEGYFSCRIRAMGGKMVLLDCEDKEELKDLVEMASDWLAQWFEEVSPWTPEKVASERFVWIRCQGVPLNVWKSEFFADMSGTWGKFICVDDSTSQKRRFDIGRFLISTPIMETISVKRSIRINGSLYNIKFTEEEFTNGFFSLKQDFLPTFHSDSEDQESWMMESEEEEWGCEGAQEARGDYGRGKEAEVEDDDVASCWEESNGKILAQAVRGSEMTVDRVSDTLQKIQTEMEGEGKAERDLSGGKRGRFENSVGPMNEEEFLLGLLEHSRRGSKEESNKNEKVPGEEGTNNVEKAQSSTWNKAQNSLDKGDAGSQRESGSVNISNGVHEISGKGYEREDDRLVEWIEGKAEGIPKKSKRRIRSCSSVYLKEGFPHQFRQERRDRRGRRRGLVENRAQPGFVASPRGEIAGGSIGDSCIQNCNRAIKKQLKKELAKEIWEIAKQLGAVAENEEEIIQRIDELECRDNRAQANREKIVSEPRVEETKLEKIDRYMCSRIWGSVEFDWCFKPSNGMSGGLLCVWDAKVFKKREILEGNNFIGVYGVWGKEETPVYILNIYSPCTLAGKRGLWEELQCLIKNRRGRWCLGGDFNATRSTGERQGSREMTTEMREFNCFIHEAELIDLPLVGRKFTWYNSNGLQMSRIDRFLLSNEWVLKWKDVKQMGLRRTVSDHCPILLKNEKVDWGPKPFKFFNAWIDQPGCIGTIRKAWKSCEVNGGYGFRLKERLKFTKKALKVWSGSSMTTIEKNIMEAEVEIEELDKKGENSLLTHSDIERRRGCFIDLWNNLKIKESMWQQKSRKMWLKEGDANTKFFHRSVNGRRRRNEICSILVNGKQLTGVTEIKEGVAEYFKNIFTEEVWQRPKLDGIGFKQISQADNELLVAPFSEEEVRKVIWECDSSKAPGPDGFNFGFLKSMWEDIKTEVIGFVKEFQEQGRLERGSNASFIVLIPKTENPQRIEEYRTISLIGVMYKVIAKLLASRLCKVLHKIIGEQQMAFIKGRQLVDGVVIANEVIDEAKRRRKKSFMFKVDFEKAYDKVCWNFIDYMLDRMAFSATWKRWIQECLKSSMVSILINGSPTRQFPVTKGIRQGDPLSPFLFLIVAEGLNGLMKAAVDKELYKGVEIGKDAVTVTHLQFADDTIFFGEASEQNVRTIKCILRTFELAAGLKINFGKCQLMGIGVDDDWRNKMAYRLGCKEGEFPFKYLGIPIGGSHRRLKMWQPLLDSVRKKLSSWKGRYLSQGGRITLINSVLSSLPVFLMSVYLIPKGTLNLIDQIRRNFLWGGEGAERKINWVKWDMICKDKEYGGLGVKDLKKFNLALMGKWWGRLATEEEGLWKRVIKGKYGGGGGHWQTWVRNGIEGGSLWWRDVQRLNNVERDNIGWLAEGFRLKMGEGREVSFWWDEWCGGSCLANLFPRLYLISSDKEKKCCQMGRELNGTWEWKLNWRRRLMEWEEELAHKLSKMIEEVKIQPRITDKWEWVHKSDGKYSSSSAYSLLTKAQQTTKEKCFKRIWNHNIPTKIAAFNWRVVLDKIPTKKNLLKRGIDSVRDDVKCRLCEEEDEDSAHLFLRCKVAKWIWKECAKWWGISIRLEADC